MPECNQQHHGRRLPAQVRRAWLWLPWVWLLLVCPGVAAPTTARALRGMGQPTSHDDPARGAVTRWASTNGGDWVCTLGQPVRVKPLRVLRYATDLNLRALHPDSHIFLGLRVLDDNGQPIEEMYAPRMPAYSNGVWQTLAGVCAVPPRGHSVQLCLTGNQACDLLIDAPVLQPDAGHVARGTASAARPFTLENQVLAVTFDPVEWSFTATDKRTQRVWRTFPAGRQFVVTDVRMKGPRHADVAAVYLPANAPLQLQVQLAEDAPEFSLRATLPPETPMPLWATQLDVMPALCDGAPESGLVVPLGEGFFFPTAVREQPVLVLQLGDGSGLTMPWAGVANLRTGAAAMWFTRDEDDAVARVYWHEAPAQDGVPRAANAVDLSWMSQKGRWGYDRTVRFWFADRGGYVALAKRYRREAAANGKLVTLAEKQKRLPQLARFRGAPIGWFNSLYHMEGQRARMDALRWLYQRGVQRMLFSSGEAIDDLRPVQRWGWLTTTYDLYSDMWPASERVVAGVSPNQIYQGRADIMLRYNGSMARGWVQRTGSGEFPGYVLCPQLQLAYARRLIPPALKLRSFDGRFIDTTTALPFYECYSPRHPMTRSDDKAARRALLKYIGDLGLICGSEIGCDWAVPETCYGEGMLSPVPFRHPRAGDLPPGLTPTPETSAYQLNPAVRIPLWELVYHDCHVAYWYWGDTNNTFPELWGRRNLFNALYAVPAMYMVQQTQQWVACREGIVATEAQLKPVFAAVGWEAMTDHKFLSSDRLLQQTEFAGGARIVVNFSSEPRQHEGQVIAATNFMVITNAAPRAVAAPEKAVGAAPADSIMCNGTGTAWTINLGVPVAVAPFDVLRYGAMLNVQSFRADNFTFLCLRVLDADRRELRNLYAPLLPAFAPTAAWQRVAGMGVAPAAARFVQVQLWGQNPAMLLARAPTVKRSGTCVAPGISTAPAPVLLSNAMLAVVLDPRTWSFAATDKRNGRVWGTFPANEQILVTNVWVTEAREALCAGIYLPANAPCRLTVRLADDAPEFSINAQLPRATRMPLWAAPLEVVPALCETSATTELVVPLGEGFLFPTTDPALPPMLLQLASGDGLCMPWFGVADRASGAAAMCFTRDEDDALARMLYHRGPPADAGTITLEWLSQTNQWGYDRSASFWFTDTGGYVALAKRYRREAAATGKLVTLAEKQKRLPQIARLRGAPVAWLQHGNQYTNMAARMADLRWLYEQGITNLVLPYALGTLDTNEVQRWDWLFSRYDLYTDVWPADQAELAHVPNRVFGYPDDIQVLANGVFKHGWVRKTEHGEFPGYVLCPQRHLSWAQRRIPPTLADGPYRARFIDTTAALPLGECYSTNHPMTRSDDKAARLALLNYVGELGLVCGSEIGCDWAVPALCYGEGMLSPVAFRHPDAGYLPPDMQPVTNTYRYMLNPAVRVPLWELVYHDCCVASWYWGDANNTFPALWPQRNLFNALYAVPPLYKISTTTEWHAARAQIIATGQLLTPVFAQIGFEEMTDHRFLTSDRTLQLSTFAGGTRVVVNFATTPQTFEQAIIAATNILVVPTQPLLSP
ncbi:MAG: hypothetical protein NTV22_18900 [bacterium]|nr:hypothetical protein [bacterium]